MLYRLSILSIFILITNLLTQCSRDSDPTRTGSDQNIPIIIQINTNYGENFEAESAKYEYDAQNRLVKFTSIYGNYPAYIESYEYSSESVKKTVFDGSKLNKTIVYKLNSQGLAATSVVTYEDDNQNSPEISEARKFDDNGFLVEESYSQNYSQTPANNGSGLKTWAILNGNITGSQYKSRVGQGPWSDLQIGTYEHYADKVNSNGKSNKGLYFLGRDSKNLIKMSSENGEVKIHDYELDDEGKVIIDTERVTFQGKTQTRTHHYTYR